MTKIQRLVAQGVRILWSNSGKMAGPVCVVLLFLLAESCARPSPPEPVTLTFLDQEWPNKAFQDGRQRELQQFTRETGIHVNFPPSPESAQEQLALWQGLLRTGAAGPDVYGIDVIWPGILNENFIDLKPYFAKEISGDYPAMIAAAYTVDNKLVAMPYSIGLGVLFYRSDLLQQYGYRAPPKTWDELESMAARIQAGERAKGRKQFWGFVWQGAAAESLTCNALEWQASEGGGRIIEEDKTISVNNPQAIGAWQRAAHWVGSISPPSVVAYKEWDALNVWVAGDAAFMRNWAIADVDSQGKESPIRNKFGITQLPGSKAVGFGTLGGTGVAVSRFSAHPREALELVRYLTRRDVEINRLRALAELPTRPESLQLPEIREANPFFAQLGPVLQTGVVSRPSNVSGKKYEEVSKAYIQAVHSVLTREKSAPDAAAVLEKELVRITGFKTGPPAGSAHR